MYPPPGTDTRCSTLYAYAYAPDSPGVASPFDRHASQPMQNPETHDAPIVPRAPSTETPPVYADGGSRSSSRPFDRPPATDHTTEYERGRAEIEPAVADLG